VSLLSMAGVGVDRSNAGRFAMMLMMGMVGFVAIAVFGSC
jgi:hypothetical protein